MHVVSQVPVFCVFEAEKDSEHGEAEAGEAGEAEEKEDKDNKKGSTETFSFGRMCAFSNEVMGQKTEGWMDTWRLFFFKHFSIIALFVSTSTLSTLCQCT